MFLNKSIHSPDMTVMTFTPISGQCICQNWQNRVRPLKTLPPGVQVVLLAHFGYIQTDPVTQLYTITWNTQIYCPDITCSCHRRIYCSKCCK